MKTIPSNELYMNAAQSIADYYNERPEELAKALDEIAEKVGEKMIQFRGYSALKDVVVVEGVAVVS